MKIPHTLLGAAAACAFAMPAAAQDMTQPMTPTDTSAPATAQPEAAQQPAQAVPPAATPTDLVVGTQVIGADGQPVGTIAQADATGAVVRSDAGEGRLNLDAFYKGPRGLLIGYTRTQFNELVGGNG